MGEEQERFRGSVVCDAHVHLHPSFDPERFFRAALFNVRRAAGARSPVLGVLCLTESAGCDAFGNLEGGYWSHPAWQIRPTREPTALTLNPRREEGALLVVSGRQVVTQEGLEVLALGTRRNFNDGEALETTLEAVRRSGALAVIPWGFGKWWGRRGRRVRDALREYGSWLFLGDNGGRLSWWPEPALLRKASALCAGILPGSDPLPFRRHETRAGSYGLLLGEMEVPWNRPWARVRGALEAGARAARVRGRRAGLVAFARDQLAMQWWKRRRKEDPCEPS